MSIHKPHRLEFTTWTHLKTSGGDKNPQMQQVRMDKICCKLKFFKSPRTGF